MVLLVVYGSKYCFILHDTGKFGSNNDSGISGKITSPLAHSGISHLTENNRSDIPSSSTHKQCTFNPCPNFFCW